VVGVVSAEAEVADVAATTATRRVTSPASAQRAIGVWMRTK